MVCGHIHRAEMREIDGVLYCNDGDWVESRTALVEHRDGRLELVHWGAAGHPVRAPQTAKEAVHVTADGRRLWVIHGDAFDGVVQCAKWLAHVGDNLYEFTLRLNRHLNRVRARLGLPYWSLSAYLKHKVKRALNYVTSFEQAVAHEARRRGHKGVVCGHIHRAEMREIDGVLYCNDGDWVESRTALVEHHDGRLELVHWGAAGHPVRAPQTGKEAA
ncbi:MAG TPA: hypothetical protein VGF26_03135 [Ramlibacter sp.]